MKHLLCRIRNDLFNRIRISRNASLDEIIAEVQQIEDILYRRAKDERLSNQLEKNMLYPEQFYKKDRVFCFSQCYYGLSKRDLSCLFV